MMMVLSNMDNTTFHSNCDEGEIHLVGHYFLLYNNCVISVSNAIFNSKLFESTQTFSVPPYKKKFSTEKLLIFRDIVLQHQNSLQTIQELRRTTLLVIVALVVFIIVLYRKQGNIQVKIQNVELIATD